MKRDAQNPMVRWRDRSPGDAAPEDRAAEILRGALVPGEPDGLQLARIERRIHERTAKRGRSSLASRLAFAGVFLVAGVATAKAYDLAKMAGWFAWSRPAKAPPKPPVPAPSSRRSARPAAAVPAANDVAQGQDTTLQDAERVVSDPPPQADPSTGVQPAVVDHARPHPRVTRQTAAASPTWSGTLSPSVDRPDVEPPRMPAARETNVFEAPAANPPPAARDEKPAAVAPVTGPAQEVRTLDEAIGLLRRQHNPAAALPMLDNYLRRYPHGILNREARLARVDALLMLERSQDALAALEGLPLDTGRRSAELQVVRGELRARLDCARAEEDFSAALTHSPDAGLLERILYGRGVCRAKLGNRRGSVDDLRRYLERFPNGAYGEPVRRWLETINKSPEKGR